MGGAVVVCEYVRIHLSMAFEQPSQCTYAEVPGRTLGVVRDMRRYNLGIKLEVTESGLESTTLVHCLKLGLSHTMK